MKKAQIEIMGLVMIVILITVGMFISYALSTKEKKPDTFKVYGDEEMATNYLITLLETNVENSDLKLHDLAVDCMRIKTGGTGVYTYSSGDSCIHLQTITASITDKTLEQGYNYEFLYSYTESSTTKEVFSIKSTDGCPGAISTPGYQPISLYRVSSTVKPVMELKICAPALS
jgi:hypothetical protein